MKMVKEEKDSVSKKSDAGAQNLQNWLVEHPEHGNLRHGGYSKHIQARYQDCRYKEAKELRGILQRLTDDAGGDGNLSEGQRLMLGVIRSKFIVSKQISDFVTKQEGIVDPKGEILPCLKSFCTFTEGMRRAIESFYAMAQKRPSKIPDLSTYLNENYGKGKE
jgi:hypothetical protein